jgi:hypothetical protein
VAGISPRVVWGIVRGTTATVSRDVHDGVSVLYEKTWSLLLPEWSAAGRRTAGVAGAGPRCEGARRRWASMMTGSMTRLPDRRALGHRLWHRLAGRISAVLRSAAKPSSAVSWVWLRWIPCGSALPHPARFPLGRRIAIAASTGEIYGIFRDRTQVRGGT